MTTDQMRAEFEAWADAKCLSLTRINWKCGSVSEYAYTATFDAWQVWQAAYAAGRKAEQEAIEAKIRREIDHAACNAMRLEPMFGQVHGELAVRVSTLEAIIDSSNNPEGER